MPFMSMLAPSLMLKGLTVKLATSLKAFILMIKVLPKESLEPSLAVTLITGAVLLVPGLKKTLPALTSFKVNSRTLTVGAVLR